MRLQYYCDGPMVVRKAGSTLGARRSQATVNQSVNFKIDVSN